MNREEQANRLQKRLSEILSSSTNNSTDGSTPLNVDGTVAGGVLTGRALAKFAPAYPLGVRISGTVIVQITVDETGRVISAKAVSGPQELRQASEQAARRWRFTPTELSGQAVKGNGRDKFQLCALICRRVRLKNYASRVAARDKRERKS
ncbi:MAG: energy transducer TonB [Pyrinomonadaceae bacterium]|nr:energy transducer TonB [Pyrinomonadaceae bacterium]